MTTHFSCIYENNHIQPLSGEYLSKTLSYGTLVDGKSTFDQEILMTQKIDEKFGESCLKNTYVQEPMVDIWSPCSTDTATVHSKASIESQEQQERRDFFERDTSVWIKQDEDRKPDLQNSMGNKGGNLLDQLKSVVLNRREENRGIVGLKNKDLLCYMNVILQCLMNAPLLADYFLQRFHKKELNPQSHGNVSSLFGDLLQFFSFIPNNDSKTIYYDVLVELMRQLRIELEKSNCVFSDGAQNDAIEFYKTFLSQISEELSRVINTPLYRQLSTKFQTGDNLQEKGSEWLNYALSRENSIITDLFGGQIIAQRTCCNCKLKNITFESFWDIPLSFNQTETNPSPLESLLRRNFQEEMLEDPELRCEACRNSIFTIKTDIWKSPEILVLTFKRFRRDTIEWQKTEDTVIFPVRELNLKPYVANEKATIVDQDDKYTLFGIVKHFGSLNSGHYTAECRNLYNQKWYKLNDEHVKESLLKKETDREVCVPSLLFYIKKSNIIH